MSEIKYVDCPNNLWDGENYFDLRRKWETENVPEGWIRIGFGWRCEHHKSQPCLFATAENPHPLFAVLRRK